MKAEARTCSVDGCDRLMSCRGWCNTHYERWRRNGDLELRTGGLPPGTRRLDRQFGYYRIKLPGHPLAWKGLDWVAEHRAVLYGELGPGPHPCHHCGELVDWASGLVADHVDGARLNNHPGNLAPSCGTCNLGRETPHVCIFCGTSLEGRRRHARCCSASCRRRAARCEVAVPAERRCRDCKEVITGRRRDADWCSERCRGRWRARKRAEPGTGRTNAKSATACSCDFPLPVQRAGGPWRCDLCGGPVPVPFEIEGAVA